MTTPGAGFAQAPAAVDAVEWETPDEEFQRWNKLYDFTLDGAASKENAKVDRFCTLDGTFEWQVGQSTALSTLTETGRRYEWVRARYHLGGGTQELRRIDPREGLHFPWDDEIIWLNPPWGDTQQVCNTATCKKKTCRDRGFHTARYIPGIAEFMQKVRDEYLQHRATIVCLLPARTDNAWFHDFVLPYATIEWHRGRISFLDPVTKEPARNPSTGTFTAVFR